MSERFEVYDEGKGWLSIWRGQNSFGQPVRAAARIYGFESDPEPLAKDRPRQKFWGVDCGPMPDDYRSWRRWRRSGRQGTEL